jgi:putative DNA primase/helicase
MKKSLRAPLARRNGGDGSARTRSRRSYTTSPAHAPLSIAAVAHAALPHLLELCRRWLPGGRIAGREWICGSLRGEAGGSCKVNIVTGRWSDFATGEKGGDVVSLAAAIHRLTQREAAIRIAQMIGMEGIGNGR